MRKHRSKQSVKVLFLVGILALLCWMAVGCGSPDAEVTASVPETAATVAADENGTGAMAETAAEETAGDPEATESPAAAAPEDPSIADEKAGSETVESSATAAEEQEETTSSKDSNAVPAAGSTSFSLSELPAYSGSAYVAVNGNTPYFSDADLTAVSYESYSSLDALGRCGVAVACVGQDLMPTDERGSIGQVKPSGWHTVKYDCVDGKYLYNRCHLIGYQLSGENANEKNLITGTRYLNIEGMLPFENMVADYVQETNNHVLYRVTPIFEGNNLLATGVLMEAESVEDDGDGILYCVFCYNVQPEITIDYATGESSLGGESFESAAEETTAASAASTSASTATTASAATGSGTENSQTVYVSSSGKIHSKSDCSGMKNYTEMTYDEAIAAGYTLCKKCY